MYIVALEHTRPYISGDDEIHVPQNGILNIVIPILIFLSSNNPTNMEVISDVKL